MQARRRAWLRTTAVAGALLLAGCGAETAIFLIAIANDWTVDGSADRSYLLSDSGDGSPARRGSFTGTEDVISTAASTQLEGEWKDNGIDFTVHRDAAGVACDDCDHADQCRCVRFTGTFQDETHMHVRAGTEDYHLTAH